MICEWGEGFLACRDEAFGTVHTICPHCGRRDEKVLCSAHVDTWAASGDFCDDCGARTDHGTVVHL